MAEAGATEAEIATYLKDWGYTVESLGAVAEQEAAEQRVAASGGPVRDFMHMAAEGATFGQADRLAGLLPGGQSRGQFQQRTDDLQMLAPGASSMAAAAPTVAMGGAKLLGRGLTSAVDAVRLARGGTPPLRPIHVPGGPLQALRALAANHPRMAAAGGTLARRTAAGMGLGGAFEIGRRLMPGK